MKGEHNNQCWVCFKLKSFRSLNVFGFPVKEMMRVSDESTDEFKCIV